jgi:biopolymer transport protein ExbD
MASRGFLIRFIDIGLIVLFGFLMISDIEMSSRVELTVTEGEADVSRDDQEERAFLVVEIAADGSFSVTDSRSGDATANRVGTVEALADALRTMSGVHRAEGLQTVVLIQPHPSSLVQRTVEVMDVSDRLSLAKSLQMDIEIDAPQSQGRSGVS